MLLNSLSVSSSSNLLFIDYFVHINNCYLIVAFIDEPYKLYGKWGLWHIEIHVTLSNRICWGNVSAGWKMDRLEGLLKPLPHPLILPCRCLTIRFFLQLVLFQPQIPARGKNSEENGWGEGSSTLSHIAILPCKLQASRSWESCVWHITWNSALRPLIQRCQT